MTEFKSLTERVELMRAMKSSPFTLKPGECDFVPPLELVGIYIAHSTVTRMVARGELSVAAGTYLNAALGCNCFCVLHHCTHESISQHNDEHEAIENVAFRLGCLLLFFDDGYKVAHRAHHARTEKPDDPDQLMSHTSLPVFGSLLYSLVGEVGEGNEPYSHLGTPLTWKEATFLQNAGVLRFLFRLFQKPWISKLFGSVNWDNMLFKMASYRALKVLRSEYNDLYKTLSATWLSSTLLSNILLALFFARYPHRNGVDLENEVDSFYDNTYRGEGQVDLWMMGEGAHHLHHAKSDVSYARLSKVCNDVEERHPHVKLASRGTGDVRVMEYTASMPAHLTEASRPSMQFPWERTQKIEEAKDLLAEDPEGAVEKIGLAIVGNALHVSTTADRALLRQLHKDMQFDNTKQHSDHPIPVASWQETVFSDATNDELLASSERIKEEVRSVARDVGAKIPKLSSDDDIKSKYFDFFVSLADVMVSRDQQDSFLKSFTSVLSCSAEAIDRDALLKRLRSALEAPIPDNFELMTKAKFRNRNRKTDAAKTYARLAELVSGPMSRL